MLNGYYTSQNTTILTQSQENLVTCSFPVGHKLLTSLQKYNFILSIWHEIYYKIKDVFNYKIVCKNLIS